jgi:hypothetical protein
MLDYSLLENAAGAIIRVPVVRGYAWPAGGRVFTLRLTRDDGWRGGEDAWTWRLLFDGRMAGGAALVSVTASAAVISGASNQYLDLSFALTPGDTTALAGAGQATILVDLESEDAQQNKGLWPEAHGKVAVRSAVGGGA